MIVPGEPAKFALRLVAYAPNGPRLGVLPQHSGSRRHRRKSDHRVGQDRVAGVRVAQVRAGGTDVVQVKPVGVQAGVSASDDSEGGLNVSGGLSG